MTEPIDTGYLVLDHADYVKSTYGVNANQDWVGVQHEYPEGLLWTPGTSHPVYLQVSTMFGGLSSHDYDDGHSIQYRWSPRITRMLHRDQKFIASIARGDPYPFIGPKPVREVLIPLSISTKVLHTQIRPYSATSMLMYFPYAEWPRLN